MKTNLTSIVRFIIPLSIGGLLLYFSFKNISFRDFTEKALLTDYSWVIGSMLLSIVAYASRAYRWQILLKPAGHVVSTFRLTLAVFVGYLANMAFPRLGEVTRCAVLKRTNDVPITISIGTVVSERLMDTLVLLMCLASAFLIESDIIISFFDSVFTTYNIDFGKFIIAGVGLIIIGLITLVIVLKSNPKISSAIKNTLLQVWTGVLTIGKIENLFGFLFSTIVMWTAYYWMSYMIVFALAETSDLSIMAGFMLLVTGGIAMALPVQGGIGTYHAMVSIMLMLYGITETTGIFLATLLHTSQVIAIAIFGGIAIVITLFIQNRKNESLEAEDL